MGTVWRATDQLLNRQVAVKELHPDGGAPATAALREARAVAQFKHPHVIVVHDVVEQDGRSYIVMELVEGGSLADRLRGSGPVDAPEAARIGIALLGALSTAHRQGVLHRDLKPANVLLEEGTGRVVLTDFGIAQLPGSTTISEDGAFVGSPEYTSPERMQGAAAGPESDLWSLGALLCAALSGESPFHRDSLGGVLHAVVTDEIRPPQAAEPLLPVVRGLLERDPGRRLAADEAHELLRAYVSTGSTPVAPRHYTPTERVAVTKPAGRPRTRAALIAAGLVVVLGGAGAATAVLLSGGDEGGGRAQAAAGGPSTATVTASSPAEPGPPGPTVTVTRSSATRSGEPTPTPVGTAPAGYRHLRDPDGFSLTVPAGFVRTTDDRRVFYVSPDGAFRLGIRLQQSVSGGPLGVMSNAHANGPSTNRGYRNGKVVATTHQGHEAALWEFSWSGFSAAEGPRHTYDECWDENGTMYDVWVSAPVARLDEAKRHFDTALDSFTPAA
ncbi:serine/threonine-protein kinase [Streptomyces sp. ERV7]|uniref:serine/threonine-protein kinase n=1 Tax=Streptomyces sp. ERV7 TaxID=1322334 RepID=UPI0009A02F8A|nr:serine/threonine-protein kinase [Streptomyces sp. ERV7]